MSRPAMTAEEKVKMAAAWAVELAKEAKDQEREHIEEARFHRSMSKEEKSVYEGRKSHRKTKSLAKGIGTNVGLMAAGLKGAKTGRLSAGGIVLSGLAGRAAGAGVHRLIRGKAPEMSKEKKANMAGIISAGKSILQTAKPMVGQAAQGVLKSSLGTRAAVGAGVGAAAGLLKSPGVDPATGQRQSRMANMVGGAAMGAGVGALSRGAVARVGANQGAVGQYVRGGLQQAGHTGTAKALSRMPAWGAAGAKPMAPKGLVGGGAQGLSSAQQQALAAEMQAVKQRAKGIQTPERMAAQQQVMSAAEQFNKERGLTSGGTFIGRRP